MNACNERRFNIRLHRKGVADFLRVVSLSALALSASLPTDARARGERTVAAASMIDGRQVGKASWYGPGFYGRRTASGQTFDPHRLTAAHPRLPLGSRARVTNLGNGRAVEVTINDRGPHGGGRIIDLSRAAARQLAMGGTALVSIETLP
ncbi:MAG: septal ring lytic transglycosylase RlpA family protein [Candidatus Contendobacter sp.]|nr:septal ring lytic transglycosylase RlpA family protein [Candidatus Contendobacter sp.]